MKVKESKQALSRKEEGELVKLSVGGGRKGEREEAGKGGEESK